MTIDERIMALGVRLKRLARAHGGAHKTQHQHEEFVRQMADCAAGVKDAIARLDSIVAHQRGSRMSE